MSIKDIWTNIKLSYYGCCLVEKDPFLNSKLKEKLAEMNITYMYGYNEPMGLYSYAITGVKGNKDEVLGELLEWFKGDSELKCFTTKNKLTRMITYNFMRK